MKVMSVGCAVAGASVVMGCSVLYNPSNLPAPLDAYVDPLAAVIDSAGPVILYEGQGTGGSRPAILVITGHNFAPDATVALVPTDGAGAAPMIQIDSALMVRGATVLAVPVTLPIDTNLGTAGASDVKLTLQVTQLGSEGFVATTLPERIVLRVLPELDKPMTDGTKLAPLYSRVQLPTTDPPIVFATSIKPVVIRAVGSIVLGAVDVNASGQVPGPAGGAGGGAANGLGLGATAGSGPAGGAAGGIGTGGGGGTISSDEWISSLATSGSSGGGGGGNPGGGGGGTLELTAGGTLTVGAINANGAPGGAPALAGGGGGGSGGVIVLRSGATATFDTITAKGGAGGGMGGNAGQPGGLGRLRYDVPSVSGTVPTGTSATIRQGAMFGVAAGTNPLVTAKDHPELSLVGGMGAMQFNIVVRDADNNTTATSNVTFTTPNVIITPALRTGYNHICIMPPGGSLTLVESTNCLDIAYVP